MSGDKLWELNAPGWTCPRCGAAAAEIRATGHRRVPLSNAGGTFACPEACTCVPQHRSLAEHAAEFGDVRGAGRYGT